MAFRKKRIRAEAERLLNEHAVSSPPVPVEKIVEALGIRLEYTQFKGDISGFAFQAGGTWVIGVNIGDAKTRQRFTIAHELGHLLLHDMDRMHLDRGYALRMRDAASAQGTYAQEVEANQFAAELLMPERFLREDLGENSCVDPLDEDAVAGLASRYGVSKQALMIRLGSLGYVVG